MSPTPWPNDERFYTGAAPTAWPTYVLHVFELPIIGVPVPILDPLPVVHVVVALGLS